MIMTHPAPLSERMPPRRKKSSSTKAKKAKKNIPSSNVINLRVDVATRSLIDRAAEISGQNRTEFMLGSARTQAENVLLNQVYFQLDDVAWEALNSTLESPPPPNSALKRLMKRTPAWDMRPNKKARHQNAR